MTLQQLIERNIERGWDVFGLKDKGRWYIGKQRGQTVLIVEYYEVSNNRIEWRTKKRFVYSLADILTNHEFAKCWFGEKDEWDSTTCTCGGILHPLLDSHYPECAKSRANRGHFYHLQQLIILPPDKWVEYYWNGGGNG